MPRPSLSRPPPTTVPCQSRDSDVENEPPTAYNVRRHGPTNRKLFFTPTQKTPSSTSPTFLLARDTITRRYYRQHDNDKTPVKTPLPRRPSNAPSTSRRPKITRLDATPSLNRTLQGSAPDRWRVRQITDLTAWLNHELSASSNAATLPMHQVASSVVFLNQFAQMNAIYRSKNVHNVLARLTNEICTGRLNVSKTIKLASFLKERDQLISLLLLNYHPHWLLLALSVVLGMNLATELDDAVEKAGARGKVFNHEQVLTQALENSIRNQFLADAPSDNVASREQLSPDSEQRDRYNALILRRTLALIYLLDIAKRQLDPIIKPDPPLFRTTSEMTSSIDVLRNLQTLLLNDHGDIVRFLSQRGYSVSYKSPVFEPFGNLSIVNLSEDMRDGTRLCKLASIMRRDHQILTQVIRVGPGHRPSTALAIKKQNITAALNSMKDCLPPNLQSRFQWHATPHDIATGNVDKTIAVLWQIAALWMEYVVVDNQKLKQELEIVKDEFRVARRNPDSPSNNVQIDLSSLADSPSKLQIIESCDTDSGDLLLTWCATLCGIYGVEIRDFTEDFRDGAVLCLILHHYCPDLMRIDEINRIPAGDYRGALAAEAEHKHVQKNLDLFMNRCRLLGTIPEIFLSSEATLAPAFHDSLKQESVGRVMQLLASYLFRRMIMQKETSSTRSEVWEIMENRNGTPEMEPSQEMDLVHEPEPAPIRKTVLVDVTQNERSERAEQEALTDIDSHELTIPDDPSHKNPLEEGDLGTNGIPDRKNGDLAHVYTRMRHVQSRRATRPRPSQLITDRENAARVIWAHYEGYKARQEYTQIRNAIIVLQSSVRGYFARRDVYQLRSANTEELAQSVGVPEPEQAPTALEDFEPLVSQVDRPSVRLDESTKSLPLRIGQQILEFIPAFRRHLFTMESYSQRMLAHEETEARHRAATVIQSAARTRLAKTTRTAVETQRRQTRRTWMSCAAEAAKAGLQMVENHRREMAKWHEELITNAIHQAGNKFASEMSRLGTAREEANLRHEQKLAEMKAAQEANFAAELHGQKVAFEAKMADMEREIQSLEYRAANAERSPVSSHHGNQDKELVATVESLITANNAREDALRLLFADLSAERERTDRLETSLRDVRRLDQENEDKNLRNQAEWREKFQSMEADIHRWRGTVLNGALCMAAAEYRLHMDGLHAVRSKEDENRAAWEHCRRKRIASFDAEECEEQLLLTDMVARLDTDSEGLKKALVDHELCLEETETQEARVNQRCSAIEADLCGVGEQLRKTDIAWVTATKEFEAEAKDALCLLDVNERTQQQFDDCLNDLEAEIESLVVKEQRADMERRLVDILETAEQNFNQEISERIEENENNAYCRHEIDVQLEQEDLEEALETGEVEEIMTQAKLAIDDLEDRHYELDEYLGRLESYTDHLFSVSPSVIFADDIPDVSGEEISESADECCALYNRSCQLMEQLCVDVSDEEDEVKGGNVSDNFELQTSPDNISIGVSGNQQQRIAANNETEIDVYDATSRIEGLYQHLAQQELEYYNGKITHDIGVQTGSGPNSVFSTPIHEPRSESGTQYRSNAEPQPSEEEQSHLGDGRNLRSPEKRPSSLSCSDQQNQDSLVYEQSSLSHVDRHQEPIFSSTYGPSNESPSQLCTSNAMQDGLPQRTSLAEEDSRFASPGPLDTLAQLALQDALDANMFENDLDECGAETSDKSLRYTPTGDLAEKENLVDTSEFSAKKNYGLKVYGLRLDSPLRDWNSPTGERSAQLEDVPSIHGDLPTTLVAKELKQGQNDEQVFSNGMPYDLDNLSVELNAFHIQPHRQSVESVVENPSSANKLESVMRRISIVASSPHKEVKRRSVTDADTHGPHRDIIRTIFVLIRYCSRSDKQLELRKLGISIICDFCMIQGRIADIIAVEECIDVLTTCLQYHRDQDKIFDPTIRVLWEISLHPDGKQLIIDSKASVARLQTLHKLLVSHVVREQKNRARIRQANMIVEIVRKRRAEGGSLKSMTEALRTARDQKPNLEAPLKDSHRLLGDLVQIIS